MSTVISKNVQVGTSGTAANNFTIFQPATPDGTLRIGNGNSGITTSLLALTSNGAISFGSGVANTGTSGQLLQSNGSGAAPLLAFPPCLLDTLTSNAGTGMAIIYYREA
jgi:hypothetical protein